MLVRRCRITSWPCSVLRWRHVRPFCGGYHAPVGPGTGTGREPVGQHRESFRRESG
jgi:hypothetical protein